MLVSIASRKLEEFAVRIGDDGAGAAIEAAARHDAYPGPVVCVIGAAGRGKSTLFDRMAGRAPGDDSVTGAQRGVRLAYDADWNGLARDLLRIDVIEGGLPVHRVEASPAGNALLIDTPPLDAEAGRALLPGLLAASDLAIMAVQITSPAGYDEVVFAQEHLRGTPAVLVITKADLVDEDDFAEGLRSVLEAYGACAWHAVLVSERSEAGATAEGLQGLVGFGHWWRTEGPAVAAAALHQRRAGLRQAWVAAARSVIEREEASISDELTRLGGELQADENLRQALEQRQKLEYGLEATVRQVSASYAGHFRELHRQLMRCTEDCFSEDPSAMPDPARVAAAWEKVLESWDERTRAQLRREMEPAIARLRGLHQEFIGCVGRLSLAEGGVLPVRREGSRDRAGEMPDHAAVSVPAPHLDMSPAEWARPGITSVLSGLGGAALLNGVGAALLGPLALPIALIGGLAAAWSMHGATASATRRRLQGELRAAMDRQLPLLQQELAERYRQDWDRLRDEITLQLAPHEQYLVLYQAATVSADLSGLRPRHEALVRRKEQFAALRRELTALASSNAPAEGV